jgi:hypothetical protein
MKVTVQLNTAVDLTPREQPTVPDEQEGWLGSGISMVIQKKRTISCSCQKSANDSSVVQTVVIVPIPTELLRPADATSHNAQIVI